MLTEGLNININDIEDDELRKEVIKYFKTFKKGKPDDEDLDEVTDDEKKEDEDGNVLKQEEITDKDGKKKKVTTHTGPRGGKFYYPDGAPKDAEHKIYIDKSGKVKECMSLRDYLVENF